MKSKKIFILLGHPDTNSSSNALALAYKEGALKAGHEVRITKLGELKFDPILHCGYTCIQELEPDLKKIQEDVIWCEHFVLVFPTWWGTMPALLKGMIDRAWLPGFAYNMKKLSWIKRLKGRNARIITTSNSSPFILNWFFGERYQELRWGTLWFSGFSCPRMTRFGGMAKPTPERLACAKRKVTKLGSKGK